MTIDSTLDLNYAALQQSAKDHLWMHFTRMSAYDNADVPIIVKGEGAYIYDAQGKRYLDALAGLFVSQIGHGRTELAEAAAKQTQTLAFHPLWSYAHPNAIELAQRVATYASGILSVRWGRWASFRPATFHPTSACFCQAAAASHH